MPPQQTTDQQGKPLGQANAPAAQPIDWDKAASEFGGKAAPPQIDWNKAAAEFGGKDTPAPGRTAPEQTDFLTRVLYYPIKAGQWAAASQEDINDPAKNPTANTAAVQAKNVSDYIYNNILGKDTYAHSNLTYDKTPSTAAGKVWQRLWGWATQDEINKIPGLEPDRVEMLRGQGQDILGRMFGKEKADQLREHILNGSYVVNVPPEEFARAAAKSLTDFFSPGYYALGAFGRVAQGYQKASQLAVQAGDMITAAKAMGKARLLGLLGAGVNIPFAASQAHDLVENWDKMNVPERIAAVSGILGASINAHVGIQHLGGYSEVAGEVKEAATVAGQATKKALGVAADRILQAAPDVVTAITRASSLTGKKNAQQKANIVAVAPELNAILSEDPNVQQPKQAADAIRNWLQQREQVLLGASGATQGSDTPVSPTLEADVRGRLQKFFSENRGRYGNDQQVEEATQKIISRLMLLETAQGEGPAALRMPNAFEAENARRGLNEEVKPQIGGEPTTNAYRAAAHETVKELRSALDSFYHKNGVENVAEFRQKEATLIDVADRLEAAQTRADAMGNGSLWSIMTKKYGNPYVLATILFGSHNPLAFGALAPYLASAKAYHNFKNPGVNIRRAVQLADANAVPTDIIQKPLQGPQLPPGGAPPVQGPQMPPGGLPTPIHPTQAATAAEAVAPAVMAEQPTNHQLNSQLATHFGEPLNHEVDGQPVTLEDRIEQVKTDAEAMRRSGIDISKTQTGKMLGLVNEHEQNQAAAIEKEQQKQREDSEKVAQELHQEFQKLQEEQNKKTTGGKLQPNQTAAATAPKEKFTTPFETTDEELSTTETGEHFAPPQTRLHELGHQVWAYLTGRRPFDVISEYHDEAAPGDHAVARSDISSLINPDGSIKTEAAMPVLDDLVGHFLAGGMAQEVHGGIPFEKNTSTEGDLESLNQLFDALEVPKDQHDRIIQQAKDRLREEFTKPGMKELMTGFAGKRKAGLGPEYHFDETQMHQLRAALDKLKKGGNNEPTTEGGNAPRTGQEASRVGEKPVAGREGKGAPEAGGLQPKQARAGLVERTTGNEDHDIAIRNGGGIPAGSLHVPGHGDYKMFHDPESGSTLTFKPSDAITPQTVGKKIAASRAEFEAGEERNRQREALAIKQTATQGGHAGGGVASEEELARPGRFVKIGRGGVPTDQGKTPDFNLGAGEAGYQVTKEGPRLVAGVETPATKRGVEQYHKGVFGALKVAQKAPEMREDRSGKERLSAVHPLEDAYTHDRVIEPMLEKFGTTENPKDARFLTPSGEMIAGPKDEHMRMAHYGTDYSHEMEPDVRDHEIMVNQKPGQSWTEAYNEENEALRRHYLESALKSAVNNARLVRVGTRISRGGPEAYFSVPARGVTAEQVENMRRVVGSVGRNGNVMIERGDITPENKDEASARKEFASPRDVETLLKQIGAHPDQAKALFGLKTAQRTRVAQEEPEIERLRRAPPREAFPETVAEHANAFNKATGRPPVNAKPIQHNPETANRIASAYEAMPHNPASPEVQKAYGAMKKDLDAQWDYAVNSMGMQFEPWKRSGQPYADSKEMMADVKNNKHLYFFQGGELPADHPLAATDPKTGLSYNDKLRAVHDLFGHAAHNFQFGPKGEENAWNVHRQMFSPEAIPALTTETRGQNSWVNFGEHLRNAEGKIPAKGEQGYVSPAERPYAKNKAGLLPEEFHQPGQHWSQQVEKAPWGGVNPNNPEAPSKTYGFEIMPEQRHNPEKLTAEEAKAYAERPEVKAALAAHPDIKLGWDTTTNGPELNIGASTDDLNTAKEMAKKLDQRAFVNTKTGKDIPAGGEGKRTSFPEYPMSQRLADLQPKQTAPQKRQEGFEHIRPELLEHMEPDERAYAQGDKRKQEMIQNEYDKIVPSIEETKAAAQAGSALGGWWRRYMETFKALGKETPEDMAKRLGPSHEEALKVWHAAVSGNKSVESANNLAWGSYADWLDAGRPRDRDVIDKIVAANGRPRGNAALSDTHRRGKVVSEGLDTTKLTSLVNSPQLRDFNPEPFHGGIFDPNNPSPVAGVTSGARKIPSMAATVAGEGNLNRAVLDTHMLDFYGANKWTDNRYIAHSIHMRQVAKELGLSAGEAQEQIWGTVLGIKQLLQEGVPTDEVPDELTNDVIKNIGKDYAEVIQNDPELSDIFARLKAHGLDPGGNKAQQRLRDIIASGGQEPAKSGGKAPANKDLLANTAERIKGVMKRLPPEQSARFKFGANALKVAQNKPEWTPPEGLKKGIPKDEAVDSEIPLSEISIGERQYNRAAVDNSNKRGSKTEGPVSIVYNPDNEQYLVEDGMHRIVQAHQEGKTTIPAKIWSGYSDVANVRPEDKMDLSSELEEKEHPAVAAYNHGEYLKAFEYAIKNRRQ